MAKRSKENITLGSGKAYIAEYDSEEGMPEVTTLCTTSNLLGHIQGGAELSWA